MIFVFAPLLLGWLLRRGALPSSGAMIPLNWAAASIVALLFFDFAKYGGGFVVAFRAHLLALAVWGVAGFIGAMIGSRLRALGRSEFDVEEQESVDQSASAE